MRYHIGLVVGKFCPLHTGHEMVIQTALGTSDRVIIISYTSLKGVASPAERKLWLSSMYPDAIVVVPETGYPDDNADEELHRVYCYELCQKLGKIPDAIFASEEYLYGFAERMSQLANKKVVPFMVDLGRFAHPISGTALRVDPMLRSRWCNPIVNAPLGKRVLFIGAESSGKTTIAEMSASVFPDSSWVPEYGREMWNVRGGNLLYEDMLHIAETQVRNEEYGMQRSNIVFCDTSPLVTKFYSEELFGRVDPLLDILAQRTYDHVFWCERDFGYVEDGTRNGVEFGNRQETFYKSNISNFTVLRGTVEERLNQIAAALQQRK